MVFDATRAIRATFLGYLIRGTLGVASIYDSMGLDIPLFDSKMSWADWPLMTLIFAVVGALHRTRSQPPSASERAKRR